MDQFAAVQNETEKKYIELKQKRLKYMKESEEHRIEMEERWHEADRQHELQMWLMFMSECGGGRSWRYNQLYYHSHYPGSGVMQPPPPPNSPSGFREKEQKINSVDHIMQFITNSMFNLVVYKENNLIN